MAPVAKGNQRMLRQHLCDMRDVVEVFVGLIKTMNYNDAVVLMNTYNVILQSHMEYILIPNEQRHMYQLRSIHDILKEHLPTDLVDYVADLIHDMSIKTISPVVDRIRSTDADIIGVELTDSGELIITSDETKVHDYEHLLDLHEFSIRKYINRSKYIR